MRSSLLLLVTLVTLVACQDPGPGKSADPGQDSGAGDTDTGDPPPPPVYNESSESGWVDVRTGWAATCALSEAGSITCWGNLTDLPPAPVAGPYVAVRVWHPLVPHDRAAGITPAGELYDLGAEVPYWDGAVVDFDANTLDYCAVFDNGRFDCSSGSFYDPGDYADRVFRSISLGDSRICGILEDGSLECLEVRPADHGGGRDWRDPPAGAYAQLSCSKIYSYADGWEWSFEGCCGISTAGELACWSDPDAPEPPEGTFAHVSAGYFYLCAVRDTGELACWGDPGLRPDPPDRTFVNVDTQGGHTCGITTEGTILCWGDDTYGQATPP